MASNWRAADADTIKYCKAVARLIKERHAVLTNIAEGNSQPQHQQQVEEEEEETNPQNGAMTIESGTSNSFEAEGIYCRPCSFPTSSITSTDLMLSPLFVTLDSGAPNFDRRGAMMKSVQRYEYACQVVRVPDITSANQKEERTGPHIPDMELEDNSVIQLLATDLSISLAGQRMSPTDQMIDDDIDEVCISDFEISEMWRSLE